MAKENKIKETTEGIEANIDLTTYEYNRLEKNLQLFNKDVPEEQKLTIEEFISLVLKISLLENELDYKSNYLKLLQREVKELETDLEAKYNIGLTGSEEVLNEELRKATLKDSTNYAKSYEVEYYNLLAKYIKNIVIPFGKDYEGAIITLKEELEEYIEKYPSDVIKAINIVLSGLDNTDIEYSYFVISLTEFKAYVNLKNNEFSNFEE